MLHRALFWCTLTTFAWAGGVQKSLFPGVSVDDEAVHFANGVSRLTNSSTWRAGLGQTDKTE